MCFAEERKEIMPINQIPKIDVSRIYNGEVTEIPFDFTFIPEETEKNDLLFAKPVRVVGRVYEKAHGRGKTESYVELAFTVSGDYATHCARCFTELSGHFEAARVYGLTKKLASEDSEDYIEIPDSLLDIGELARTVFYLELPSRVLCKEDCKGLCPACGINKNEQNCSCKIDTGANKLADLKKYLDK